MPQKARKWRRREGADIAQAEHTRTHSNEKRRTLVRTLLSPSSYFFFFKFLLPAPVSVASERLCLSLGVSFFSSFSFLLLRVSYGVPRRPRRRKCVALFYLCRADRRERDRSPGPSRSSTTHARTHASVRTLLLALFFLFFFFASPLSLSRFCFSWLRDYFLS